MNRKEVTKEMLSAFSKYEHANNELIHKWTEIVFLSTYWWIGLILAIAPWFLWWKLHTKKYTGDLLRAGLLMGLLCVILDGVGVQLGLWFYPYKIFPFIPGYFPWDLTVFPITMMTFIEIIPKLNRIYKAIILSSGYAFIGEPLAYYFNVYEPLHWKAYYSFPIYIILFFICDSTAKSKIFNSRF